MAVVSDSLVIIPPGCIGVETFAEKDLVKVWGAGEANTRLDTELFILRPGKSIKVEVEERRKKAGAKKEETESRILKVRIKNSNGKAERRTEASSKKWSVDSNLFGDYS